MKFSGLMLQLFARIGGLDDGADGFLIEPLEPAFALEVFQVAADGAVGEEGLSLRVVDLAELEKTFQPVGWHGPAFSFGEGLLEKVEIRKGFHGGDARLGQL